MIQVFSQVSLCSFPYTFCVHKRAELGLTQGLVFLPSPARVSPAGDIYSSTWEGLVLALEQNLIVLLPQILGFLEPALWAGSGPELGMGSLGLIGTLPGPAARGPLGARCPLGARRYPHSSLRQAPARAGYQPLYPVGRNAASLLNQPHSHVFTYLAPSYHIVASPG